MRALEGGGRSYFAVRSQISETIRVRPRARREGLNQPTSAFWQGFSLYCSFACPLNPSLSFLVQRHANGLDVSYPNRNRTEMDALHFCLTATA